MENFSRISIPRQSVTEIARLQRRVGALEECVVLALAWLIALTLAFVLYVAFWA